MSHSIEVSDPSPVGSYKTFQSFAYVLVDATGTRFACILPALGSSYWVSDPKDATLFNSRSMAKKAGEVYYPDDGKLTVHQIFSYHLVVDRES